MTSLIPYGRQSIESADIQAVMDVLQSDWLTQGPAVPAFEKRVADYCGARYAVAVSNGTAALHLACLAAGLTAGDTLWTSPNTFVASANCGLYCGASIGFVDIDPQTYNLSPIVLAQKLEQAAQANQLPKVLVPVHFSGQSCQMEEIRALTQSYGIQLIEDASHALGASYKNQPVGSCLHSEMAILSFHPVKMITTGEGGMILTNREDLYQKLVRLRTHGITRDAEFAAMPLQGPWDYQQVELGFNYRMTDIQAALGLSQMDRLDAFVSRRRQLAQRYEQLLLDLAVILPKQHGDTNSSWHLYVIGLQQPVRRREVFEALRAQGIGVNVHYIPVHTQPYYQQLGFQWGDYPAAEAYYQGAITLPLFYDLTETEQDTVVAKLREALT